MILDFDCVLVTVRVTELLIYWNTETLCNWNAMIYSSGMHTEMARVCCSVLCPLLACR